MKKWKIFGPNITDSNQLLYFSFSSLSPLASPNKEAVLAANAIKSSTDDLDTVTFGKSCFCMRDVIFNM